MSAKERLKAAAYSSARLGTDKVIPLADAVREIETLEAERDGWRDSAKRMADKCDDLTQELQAAEERRITILEWLENEIGTGWNCDCGRTEYNTLPFCQQCAKDAPLLHLLAFKLHAARNDSSEAQKQSV